MSIFDVVFLLLVANGAPLLADCLLRKKLSIALDAGLLFMDGQSIFGTSKTVRGVVASVVATTSAALVIGQSPTIGLWGANSNFQCVYRRFWLTPRQIRPRICHNFVTVRTLSNVT